MADKIARRAAHAFAAGVAATACWAAAEELGSRKPVRVASLLMMATAAMAGMAAAKPSAKTRALENRFNDFKDNGGHIGGNLHIAGDHKVDGQIQMNGSGGIHLNGNQVDMGNGSLNNLNNLNSQSGNIQISGGGLDLNGHNLVASGGNIGWMSGPMSHSSDTSATTIAGLRDYINNSLKQKLVNAGYMS